MKKNLLFIVLAFICVTAFAQDKVFVKAGIAINGYDAVGYFTEGRPVKGNEAFHVKLDNATWLFTSKENLEKFKKDPGRYKPQFGGFCAYGMSRGYAAPTDPNAWTVVNDKLYLNYNLDVKQDWLKDQDNLISKAEKNWTEQKDK